MSKESKACREACEKIVAIFKAVDHRCSAADGPVTPTISAMTSWELMRIYEAASGALTLAAGKEKAHD